MPGVHRVLREGDTGEPRQRRDALLDTRARDSRLSGKDAKELALHGIVLSTVRNGGAEGIRTPDPLNAIEVLSQLSYSPT